MKQFDACVRIAMSSFFAMTSDESTKNIVTDSGFFGDGMVTETLILKGFFNCE
jgi:hypothetical protein